MPCITHKREEIAVFLFKIKVATAEFYSLIFICRECNRQHLLLAAADDGNFRRLIAVSAYGINNIACRIHSSRTDPDYLVTDLKPALRRGYRVFGKVAYYRSIYALH